MLKEQQKLLDNCINLNEVNKLSICEAIYYEKEQVNKFNY